MCKSIVGIDANQLYPYAMCQDMFTGLYTHWEYKFDIQIFKPKCNKALSFRKWSWHTFNILDLIVEYRVFIQRELKKISTALVLMDSAIIATQFLKLWFAFINFLFFKKFSLVQQMNN